MSEQPRSRRSLAAARSPEEQIGTLRSLYYNALISWRLFWDKRVGFWPKMLPILGLIYVISPADLLPAWLMGPLAPLGVVDDLGAIVLALSLFIRAAPPDIVQEYMRELGGRLRPDHDEDVIDGYAETVDE